MSPDLPNIEFTSTVNINHSRGFGSPPPTALSCVITFSPFSITNGGTINGFLHLQQPITGLCNNIIETLDSLTSCHFLVGRP